MRLRAFIAERSHGLGGGQWEGEEGYVEGYDHHRLGFRGVAERLAIGLALPIESRAVRVVRWCQAMAGLRAVHGSVARCVKGAERAIGQGGALT
jgi:hypothetical protein